MADVERQKHTREVFRLPDLLAVTSEPDFIIENHDFEGCSFYGPAVFVFTSDVEFAGNQLNGDSEGLFWEIPPDRQRVIGAFGLRDSSFLGCTFTNIGIAGTAELIAQFNS